MKKTMQYIIAIGFLLLILSEYSFAQTPTYIRSDVQNSTPSLVEMTFSLSLANIVPATSAFAVRVNSVLRNIIGVSIYSEKVVLALATPIVNGDVVSVSYDRPTINPLMGIGGAIVSSLTNQSVINNCLPSLPATVTDIDGNVYNTITIAKQVWIKENLKVTNFSDGKPIAHATNGDNWLLFITRSTSGYCWYNDDPSYENIYGALYNWYSVATGNLCPTGWHVPSSQEMNSLTFFLGGDLLAGGRLKETGTAHWTSPNTDATDLYGFTALPGGSRNDPNFGGLNNTGFWWTSTEGGIPTYASFRSINYYDGGINAAEGGKGMGMSVRCLNNVLLPTLTTFYAVNISANSAQVMGMVTDDGGGGVSSNGIIWSTTPNPSITFYHTTEASETGIFTSTLTGLSPGTTYYARAYATNSSGTGYGPVISFTTSSGIPTVNTYEPSWITSKSAKSGGVVTSDGDSYVTQKGICWSTEQDPTIDLITKTSNGTGTGHFSSDITGLIPETKYYVRAYATNINGTAFGEQFSFTTTLIDPPTGITGPTSFVSSTSARLTGTVNANGVSTNVSFNYGLMPISSTQMNVVANPNTVTGTTDIEVSANLTGLEPGKDYYFYIRVESSGGAMLGENFYFTTPENIQDVSGNLYNTVIIGEQTWMQENLRTIKYSNGEDISDGSGKGDYSLEAAPKYWFSYNDDSENDGKYGKYYTWYTATDTRNLCPTGWRVPTQNDWQALVNYLASNGFGYDGGPHVGKASASSSDWISDPTEGNVGNDQASNNSSGFNGFPGGNRNYGVANFYNFYGMGIYGRYQSVNEYDNWTAYMGKLDANDDDLNIFSDGKKHGFNVRCIKGEGTPLIYMPTLNTTVPFNITASSVRTGGTVVTDGNATITERGVCWNTSGNPTIGDNHLSSGSELGEFTVDITNGLLPGTRYYAQAYAINNDDKVGYGDEVSFTTGGPGVLTDMDGNNYQTVTIGTQTWMAENLKVTHLYDGTPINYVTDYSQWGGTTTPAYCWDLNNPGLLKDIFGALYNWYTVNTEKLCPQGWHVPSQDDWNALITSQGGASSSGAALKEAGIAHWYSPNTGTNSSGFSGLPGGYRMGFDENGEKTGFFDWAYQVGYWWTATRDESILGDPWAWSVSMRNSENNIVMANYQAKGGMSVRCLMNPLPVVTTAPISKITKSAAQGGGTILFGGSTTISAQGVCWNASPNPTVTNNHTTENLGSANFTSQLEELAPGVTYYVRAYATNSAGTAYGEELTFITYRSDAISDFDGNYYNIVTIGKQDWMQENLKTTKYNDGSVITHVTDNSQWAGLTTPAYAWFNNDENAYKDIYGALYNWFVVSHGNICPVGWIVPSMDDWNQLRDYLGGETLAGGKMKETGTLHWQSPNEGADNSSGFIGLPGGYRTTAGTFGDILVEGMFWTSTDGAPDHAFSKHLRYYDGTLFHGWDDYVDGFSIRCIRDPLIVINTNDSGAGSLRNAIEYANSKPGNDPISFNIPGQGPHTIMPLSAFPNIVDQVVIDGYTQPGSISNSNSLAQGINAVLKIELDGTNAGEHTHGLTISTDNCVIRGLVINRFSGSGSGIYIKTGTNNKIEGNFLGTSALGTADMGNNLGVQIDGSGNYVGGTSPRCRNLISGNNSGILFGATASGNFIQGNYIGTDISGNNPLPNTYQGINSDGGHENTIGGALYAARNIISGNNGDGIYLNIFNDGDPNTIEPETGFGNIVQGNFIGLSASGSISLKNKEFGIRVDSKKNIIGGLQAGARNVVSGNGGDGILTYGLNATENLIQGNFIGTDSTGNAPRPNAGADLRLNNSPFNTIGGTSESARNVILRIDVVNEGSNNNVITGNFIGLKADGTGPVVAESNWAGILISDASDNIIGPANVISGVAIGILITEYFGVESVPTANNKIIGNLIGTNADGNVAVGNLEDGIVISAASNNKVGGSMPGERNIISGNKRFGIILTDDARYNEIKGNFIGSDASGIGALPNFTGIHILGGQNNFIGGAKTGEANLISGNLNEGILMYGPIINNITHFSDGNTILGNIIGLSINGTDDLGNGTNGIRIDNRSRNNTLGGANPGERNFISGNGGNGITIAGPFTRLNRIIGNYIGTDITGKVAIPNVGGVNVVGEAFSNYIGGPSSDLGNLIANNTDVGIWLMSDSTYVEGNEIYGHSVDDIFISGNNNNIGGSDINMRNYIYGNHHGIRTSAEADFNRIEGNYIGTDRSGRIDQTEGYNGVALSGSDNIVLNNLISGFNQGHGVYVYRWDMSSPIPDMNRIEANLIGLDATGTEFIPNQHGISINSAVNTKIIRNKIAGNQYDGIHIADNFFQESDIFHASIGSTISQNYIYSNGQMGIELNMDFVTPNDEGDIDIGPNNLQNFPVIDSLNYTSSSVYLKGRLNSAANSEYTLEFFANKVADNTGYGEGRTYLGSKTVTTNNTGTASFSETFSRSTGWGDVITATATDAQGNTSEFSEAVGGLQDQIIAAANWPFRFKVNEDGVPRITDGSDITAVGQSFATWQNVSTAKIDFVNDGTTTQKTASATDHVNLISFVDNAYPFPKNVLAIAAKTLQVSPNDDVARIIDADIVVNPVFSDHDVGVGNGDFYDAQSIITHEIGHVMGLLHTGVINSTMFYMLGYGTKVRSLEQDDRSWVSYKYPGTSYNSTFGSISGHISYGYNGDPVAGALVMAIRTSITPNDTIHAYSDADGNYLVPGLPTGSYNIYIQPLDGSVNGYNLRPGNISTYIYCNTIYTDYPGEYLSIDESDSETTDAPALITVSAGSITAANDIFTNRDLTHPTFISVGPTDPEGELIKVLSNFVITFSEPVDESTLTSQTCYLELGPPDNKQVGGTFSTLPESTNVVIFNPESVLDFTKTYSLHLTSGIKDLRGNPLIEPAPVSFTTVDKDGVAPTIKGTYPVNSADSVLVSEKVKVIFSESMNTESLNDNFALTWIGGNPAVINRVDGSITWDAERTTLTFTPSWSLSEATDYTITVSTGATDLSANPLADINIFTFSTVEVAAPEVKYLGPTNTQTGVTIETPVVADFSEAIDPLSVTSSTFFLKASGSPTSIKGEFEFLNGNARVVFKPETNLLPGTVYTTTLTTGIKDVSATVQSLAADVTATFTTASTLSTPSISFLNPTNGKVGHSVTISGAGFDYVPSRNVISFNGIIAPVETATLNTLTTKVPLGTLSGPVTVTVNGRTSNQMQFDIIPDYLNNPEYATSNKSLPSGSSGGTDIYGNGEAVFALVTNPENNSVTRIVLATGTYTQPIQTGGLYPVKVDIDQQGKYAYVTNYYSHDVSVINLATNKVSKIIPVGVGPYGVAVTSDGKRVYVSNYESGNLSLIDVDPTSGGFDHVVANVSTGSNPGNIAVTADAGMVLVTGPFGLKIVDSNPKSVDYNSVTATVSSGTKTTDVTVTADAGFAIVATDDGNLLIINLHPENDDYSGAVVASVPTGTKVSDVKASGDAVYVYATDTENNQILVYKFSVGGTGSSSGSSAQGVTLIPIDPILVPDSPSGLNISPAGDKIYTVTALNSYTRQVTTISLTGLKISPENTIESLISTVQTLIDNKLIKKANGIELISYLNSALSYLSAGKTKDAINRLNSFVVKVQDYVKSKQLTAGIGQPMIDAAKAVISYLNGIKSEDEEFTITGVDTQPNKAAITETKLGVIYPNPSKDAITINYEIAESDKGSEKVMIQVYDVIGRLVSNLVTKDQAPGRYNVTWNGYSDAGEVASRGFYFVRFSVGNIKEVRQIMLIR